MAGNQSSKVTADLKRNRLIITISATASHKEAKKIYTDIRFCVADLQPGFDVITDFSGCTLAHLSAIATMRQIMDYLVTKQPRNIIRVVKKNSVVFKQLLHFITHFQSYKPIYANSLEDADEILSKLTQRNGLRYHIFGHQVEYIVDQERGQGRLLDISISGCAVQEPTLPVSMEQELSIVIPIDHGNDLPGSFASTAKIVRVEDGLMAVQFLDLDEDQKSQLRNWFAYEVRQEPSPKE